MLRGCWGHNSDGEIKPDAAKTVQPSPVAVAGLTGVAQVAVMGFRSICARLTVGTVKCWGDNSYGQLGDGTLTLRTAPTTVVGVANALDLQATRSNACALLSDGTARCWGLDLFGQLGFGSLPKPPAIERPTPVKVVVDDLAAIGGPTNVNCALRKDGTLYCYGDAPALGDGSGVARPTPAPVVW